MLTAKKGSIPALFALALLISSCSVISTGVRQQVDPIPFEALRANPAAHVGKAVLLGGHIVEVQNLPEKTRIVVLQSPLGSQDRPQTKERSQGRFVILGDGFLDPEVYRRDLAITVAGTVLGSEIVRIDDHSYPTVAVSPLETHLWQEEVRRPRRGPYYDPFYYDPFFYNPFFYDPYYPWPGPHYLYRPPLRSKRR